MIEMRKLEVKFNKTIYMDMCILDIGHICTNFITIIYCQCITKNVK